MKSIANIKSKKYAKRHQFAKHNFVRIAHKVIIINAELYDPTVIGHSGDLWVEDLIRVHQLVFVIYSYVLIYIFTPY